MPTPSLDDRLALEAYRAVQKHGTKAEAARQLNIAPSTFDNRYARAIERGVYDLEAAEKLEGLGYSERPEMTPEEAWGAHEAIFERKMTEAASNRRHVIKRGSGPFSIFHSTDQHLDDDTTPLKLIKEDIAAAKGMDAVMCHGGDALNNWPVMGKLAKKWAEQSCTLPAALLRAQHFFEMLDPDVAVHGNHEEMNPYLTQILEGMLPKKCIVDSWTVNFTIKAGGAPPYRVRMSHKFQKGSSWFHKAHGHIREMLEAEECDLLMDGHLHSDGVLDHSLPERGHASLCVASAGYKVLDSYARRISRANSVPKLRGRAHWIIVDPAAAYDEDKHIAFKCPRRAEAYLNSLQNLQAA